MDVSYICPENFLLWVHFYAINATYMLMMLFVVIDFHYFPS